MTQDITYHTRQIQNWEFGMNGQVINNIWTWGGVQGHSIGSSINSPHSCFSPAQSKSVLWQASLQMCGPSASFFYTLNPTSPRSELRTPMICK